MTKIYCVFKNDEDKNCTLKDEESGRCTCEIITIETGCGDFAGGIFPIPICMEYLDNEKEKNNG